MIAVIDYGAGNLRNVCKAIEFVGGEINMTADARVIAAADKIVLPGVGAFEDCAAGLRSRGLWQMCIDQARGGKPFLGICVGMQLLFDVGEEMGFWPGLGLISGRIVRFNFTDLGAAGAKLKVPHIGWNQLRVHDTSHYLVSGVADQGYAWFANSFHAVGMSSDDIVASSDYGYEFPAVVAHENVMGIQFHPEKSQEVGLQMLRNFCLA